MTLKKMPPKWPKSKGVNLNFLDIFGMFKKSLKKASLGLKTRFKLVLSFIGHKILEKINFEKSAKK